MYRTWGVRRSRLVQRRNANRQQSLHTCLRRVETVLPVRDAQPKADDAEAVHVRPKSGLDARPMGGRLRALVARVKSDQAALFVVTRHSPVLEDEHVRLRIDGETLEDV